MHLCVDLLNEILDGFEDINTAIHLCRRNKGRDGWVGEGGYEPIMDCLKQLRVNSYMLEFAIPVAGDFGVLREIPEDRAIGLGCVDCRNEWIDTPEEIVTRVEKALRYVSPERLFIHSRLRICARQRGSHSDRRSLQKTLQMKLLRARYSGRNTGNL